MCSPGVASRVYNGEQSVRASRSGAMAVLALVVQDLEGQNIHLSHRPVLHLRLAFRLSQLVHSRLRSAGHALTGSFVFSEVGRCFCLPNPRLTLALPCDCLQPGPFRVQYRRVHEVLVLAVVFARQGDGVFEGGICLTEAARVLFSACRSQRVQTVTVRELANKRERLAEELEKTMYGDQGAGLRLADYNRGWADVRAEAQNEEALRNKLNCVDFSLPESLLSAARKHNVRPKTPSRKNGLGLRTSLTADHYVPSLQFSADQSSADGGGTIAENSDVHSVRPIVGTALSGGKSPPDCCNSGNLLGLEHDVSS